MMVLRWLFQMLEEKVSPQWSQEKAKMYGTADYVNARAKADAVALHDYRYFDL